MKKNKTTFNIKLDHIDALTIRSGLSRGTEIKPLWSTRRNQQYYRFELKPEDTEECSPLDTTNIEYSTVTCHVCNIKVPTKYVKEHKSSEKHTICKKLVDTALQRVKDHTFNIDTRSPHTGSVAGYFCEPCSVLVTKENHDTSPIHKSSALHDKMLKDLLMVYTDKENIHNINLQCLTRCKNQDIENNELKHATDSINKVFEVTSKIKYPTNRKSDDLIFSNNSNVTSESKNQTDDQNQDFENRNKFKFPTESKKKDIENNNELKNATESKNSRITKCQNKDLEDTNDIKYPINCESDNVKLTNLSKHFVNDEFTFPIHFKNKDVESSNKKQYLNDCKTYEIKGNDTVKNNNKIKYDDNNENITTDQVIYKHTRIITDLKSMENYIKILTDIFPQKSPIYVYVNRMLVGIHIGDYKLKVHVNNFLGIHEEYNLCLLCSTKFIDKTDHIYGFEHMKKVMSPIKDHHCIKQIKETGFYCVLCAEVIANKDNQYADTTDNIPENVTAHVQSKKHKVNFKKVFNKSRYVSQTPTIKTFHNEHICNVCESLVSNSDVKYNSTGKINNYSYKEYFCLDCQMITPLKSLLQHIEDDDDIAETKAEKYKKCRFQPRHTIKTYCGACDLYIETLYLENHTNGNKHKERTSGNASFSKLAQTKPEPKQKAIKTDQSERNKMSVTNEILEDLLWAQMKVSKNPKEVICKVCYAVVPKALKDVQKHIKGENHQRNFSNLLLSCNMENIAGLDQIFTQIDVNVKPVRAKCEYCNVWIPNIRKNIEEHIAGDNHQNNINLHIMSCKMEKYKTYYADSQAASSNQADIKPASKYDAVVTSKAIPIEELIKINNKDKVKKLRPIEKNKKGIQPVNAQVASKINMNNKPKICKAVLARRHVLEATPDSKQYHCRVCNVEFPLSDTHMSKHLLGSDHVNKYNTMLKLNCILERRRPSNLVFCKYCNVVVRRQMILTHIEELMHREMRPLSF